MASAEQPLKKRKLYEPSLEPPSPSPPPPAPPPPAPGPPQQTLAQGFLPPILTQEEILRKRRNKEEIRNLYDCYKRIRFCVSQKDARLMPDLEQTYLAFITASRGCTSVQRIVADLIPRYASYCPTALEAAAKVVINMHNWSLALITRGEDADGIAFQTAKTCILGLADICCTASVEAPTSSVIRGICSAVFLNVLSFFISSFEGRNIFQIVDKEIIKIQDSTEFFFELQQKFSNKDESALVKLSKFRVLSLLRIFFSCPKNSLAACFELFNSTSTEGLNRGGHFFLKQVTSKLDVDGMDHLPNSDGPESCTNSIKMSSKGNEVSNEGLGSDGNHVSGDASPFLKNCLLGLVLQKDSTLRSWISSRFKKLSKSASTQAVSEITSALEGIFESFTELVSVEECQLDNDEDCSDPSKYISPQYLVSRISNQHETSYEISGKDSASRLNDRSCNDGSIDKVSSQYLKSRGSVVSLETEIQSNLSSEHNSGGSRSRDFESGEQGDSSRGRSSMPSDMSSNQLLSPIPRKSLDFRTDSFEGKNHLIQVENSRALNMDFGLPALRSSSGGVNNALTTHKQCFGAPYSLATSQIVWYSDCDPAAMDIFSASRQLWLGSLGPDASEAQVRFQFEKFGPIEQFYFFAMKRFALVDYRNIMDAVKAREYMRGRSPWGANLIIKFLDVGLGTRGAVHGVAVGSSCHVYVGNVTGPWAKDEILHESMKLVYQGPRAVTDLTSEGALLIEFETPEEAARVMAHLRQHRRESSNYHLPQNAGLANTTGCYMDGTRPVPALMYVDVRSTNPAMPNNVIGSPQAQMVEGSPADSCRTRQMSHLSSMLSSLCTKYNILPNSSYSGNHMSGKYQTTATREEDRLPTNTVWINLSNSSSSSLADDELMAICNVAIGNAGSVVRLTRANTQLGCSWFVECSSVDAAVTVLKNLRGCPGTFFQLEFSSHHAPPYTIKPEASAVELASPGIKMENHTTAVQSGHALQLSWASSGHIEMHEIGERKVDNHDNNIVVDPPHGGGNVVSGGTEQLWTYKKPEMLQPAPGSIPCVPTATHGPTIAPPPQIQVSPYIRPLYLPPNSCWDARGLNHQLPSNLISPGMMPNNFNSNTVAAPFLPASVTPLAQIQGSSMQHFDQMFSMPAARPPLSCPPPPLSCPLPPLPGMPPLLPSSPPPLPQSQPPFVPPPPSSPPPLPPAVESSNAAGSGQSLQYQWQGTLCKSGVHYCTVYAHRVDSNICKYSNAISEPAEWPAKLDMTKRTDFRHVKSTFTGTPPHKFQDFISYLKQRECAGVIKIPAVKSMWARLLFILPHSHDACSMLSIAPNTSEYLIALALPKETNFEWV
ncbi:uncharacterized protein LOC131161610 isoform X2 [Malania oleifera]|uniref:uncharacterized protein LOC131161610 isoform X2 n=1 Tax=Malania oleifera TaxID=397392 RepID=UPI0025ADB553|nr:uncharacterized protein LOC131161610 isoform X2 [Malania oleifera]